MRVKIFSTILYFCMTLTNQSYAEYFEASVQEFLSKITTPTKIADQASQAYWAPCGNYVAYTFKSDQPDIAGGIHVLKLDGTSTVTKLTESGKDPVWSPDGQWIAFVEENKNDFAESVWLIDANGYEAPVFLSEGGYPNWFPDSEHLLIQSRNEQVLYKLNFVTRVKEKLLDFPYPYPALSSDGERIVVPGSGNFLYTCDLKGQNALRLCNIGLSGFLGRWSPQDDRIVFGGFLQAGNPLSMVNAGEFNQAIPMVDKFMTRPAWSPDGHYIVCDTGMNPHELWILPADLKVPEHRELSVTLDVSEKPEHEQWGLQAKELIEQWYYRTINLMATPNHMVPNQITLTIKDQDEGVAQARGGLIEVFSGWIEQNPEDIGCIYHELVHVVQAYQQHYPSWIVEGIADYYRWVIYEGKPLSWFVFQNKEEGYQDSYQVTAGFFFWLESEKSPGIVKRLNTALRRNEYQDVSFFEEMTDQTIDELWQAYVEYRLEN